MTKETIDVSMTQQVEREREREGKKEKTKTWRCTSSTCLSSTYSCVPLFFVFSPSLCLFLSLSPNRVERIKRGQKPYLLTLFEDAMYTVIDCLLSSSYFHLYQTSSTIDYFFFFLHHRRRRRIFSLSPLHSSNRFVAREIFFLIGYLGFISIKRKTFI